MQIYKPYNLLSFFAISRNIYPALLHTTRSLRCHHHRVLLDCQLVSTTCHLAQMSKLSRAAMKRESRRTWTGREKCILGAPTIVPSLGSRI